MFDRILSSKASLDICALTETHANHQLATSYSLQLWPYKSVWTAHSSNSAGVALIILNQNITASVLVHDPNGTFLVVSLSCAKWFEPVTLVIVYAPSKSSIRKEWILHTLSSIEISPSSIVIGDFNFVESSSGRFGGKINGRKNGAKEFLCWKETHNLADPWQSTSGHPCTSYHSPSSVKRTSWSARLDRSYITPNLKPKVVECHILPLISTISDHSANRISINMVNNEKGPGYWKFNNALLSHPKFIKATRAVILGLHLESDYAEQWSNFKNMVKNLAVKFGAQVSKLNRCKSEEIIDQLSTLSSHLDNHPGDKITLASIDRLSQQLSEHDSAKLKGIQVRSRVKWDLEGERPTKFFSKFEKSNAESKTISSLKDPTNDTCYSSTPEKLVYARSFYEKLFSGTPHCHSSTEKLLSNVQVKISQENTEKCDALPTIKEVINSINELANGSSPGLDGLTAEFYKAFVYDLAPHLLNLFLLSIESNALPGEVNTGTVTLLPKPDKDLNFLANWRPIWLLNVDYKIFSSIFATRLKTTLPTIIHQDQTAYLSGRSILDNVLSAVSALELAPSLNITGFLAFLDCEKAFDRLNHEFLMKTLTKFGFGKQMRHYISMLITNFNASISINGFASEFFNVMCGSKQGDPISGLLFILCIEPLACAIRLCPRSEPIKIFNTIKHISLHADDTTLWSSSAKGMIFQLK